MTVRPLKPEDAMTLGVIAAKNGFEYPALDDPHLEAVLVVEDSEGKIICAAATKRILEEYLWMSDGYSPIEKWSALRLLHTEMAKALREKGFFEINTFLPPAVEKSFGARLRKSFGWRPNWNSLFLRF